MNEIIESLKGKVNQSSTRSNYLGIWRNFNKFLIKLDRKPKSWEDRTAMYIAYLVKLGYQSSTVRSYTSAIKASLRLIDYEWSEKKLLISTLTKACKICNDVCKTRLPIGRNLLKLILAEVDRKLSQQVYLKLLYRSVFMLAYYGLLRIGEICKGPHAMKAKDIHINERRDRLMIVLYSSKTHGRNSRPQTIIIKKSPNCAELVKYCPVESLKLFLTERGSYKSDSEILCVFRDKQPITAKLVRKMLRSTLKKLGLDPSFYDTHSFRIGRATDLAASGHSIEDIKRAGRWKSNAVYKYLR